MSSPEQEEKGCGSNIGETAASSSSKIPAASSADELATDYAELAQLMQKMDQEVGSFTTSVEKILNSASAYDRTRKVWEEQAKTISEAQHKQRGSPKGMSQRNNDSYDSNVLGDEADNKSDPLIFV